MTREQKSPQEKKRLAYTKDHFSPGEYSSSRHSWRRKKTYTNREYRRRGDELFAVVKPGMEAEEVAQMTEDLTVGRLQKSITRRKLRKWNVITLAEKVPLKLERREDRVGRRVAHKSAWRNKATTVIKTLNSLEGNRLVEFVKRFAFLYSGKDPVEYQRLMQSSLACDQALSFIYEWQRGSGYHRDAICEDEELRTAWSVFAAKFNRILARDKRVLERKVEEKRHAGKTINTLRRGQRVSLREV